MIPLPIPLLAGVILAGFLVGGISGSVRCGGFSSEQEMLLYCVDIVTSATAIVRPA
jgi:hypothetical protein